MQNTKPSSSKEFLSRETLLNPLFLSSNFVICHTFRGDIFDESQIRSCIERSSLQYDGLPWNICLFFFLKECTEAKMAAYSLGEGVSLLLTFVITRSVPMWGRSNRQVASGLPPTQNPDSRSCTQSLFILLGSNSSRSGCKTDNVWKEVSVNNGRHSTNTLYLDQTKIEAIQNKLHTKIGIASKNC